jgi:hypothetical protein
VKEIITADAGETTMRYEPFGNLFVTPVLPFGDDGEIDEPAYRAFLRCFLTPATQGAGMALIANPEAGELFTLDREKRGVRSGSCWRK